MIKRSTIHDIILLIHDPTIGIRFHTSAKCDGCKTKRCGPSQPSSPICSDIRPYANPKNSMHWGLSSRMRPTTFQITVNNQRRGHQQRRGHRTEGEQPLDRKRTDKNHRHQFIISMNMFLMISISKLNLRNKRRKGKKRTISGAPAAPGEFTHPDPTIVDIPVHQ
jgi:hypothetical protein